MIGCAIEEIFTNKGYSMTQLLDTTGKRVERLRKDRGMNQVELARAVNVRQNYISAIERDVATPSAEVMAGIARALETTLDFLMLLTDNAELPKDGEPTRISEEAEQAARLIDEMADTEARALALNAVTGIHSQYSERAQKERLVRDLLGLIEASNGIAYRRDIERRLGLVARPQSNGESSPFGVGGNVP